MNTFRHSAGFGKRIEYWIVARMLKEGMDVYLPLVDDHSVDAIVKRADGSIAQVQIKARSLTCVEGDAALFAAIPHPEEREDYWFVFYSERMEKTWILTSAEFIIESVQNKTGKNLGKRSSGSTDGEKAKQRTLRKTIANLDMKNISRRTSRVLLNLSPNKSLEARGGRVFRNLIRSAMLE